MSYLISLILLLLPSYLIRFSIEGIPTTALEVLIYVVFLIGLWQAKKTGFHKIPLKIYLPISLFIIALAISTIIASDKLAALGLLKGFFIDPLLVFWLIWQFIKKEDLLKLFWGLIGSGTFVALHTIILKILGNSTADGRVIGIFGYSPNYVALFLAPVAVLLIAYGLQLTAHRKYLLLMICGPILVISLAAIYFSGSRGGFLAILGGTGIFILSNFWGWIRQRISAKIIIAILILSSLYISWTYFQPDFSVSPENGGRIATSNNLRWQIWETTLELAKEHPLLGVGLGNFQNAFGALTQNRPNFPEYITPMALTPHNIFLLFWLETGILGLVAFIWLLVIFFHQALKNLNSKYSPIILGVMSTLVLYGFIEASIWKNDLSIIFWVIWGMIWVI